VSQRTELSGEELVAIAERIASEAHDSDVDRAGAPYIEHPRRVASRFSAPRLRAAALLHDVIEDTEWTAAALRDEGIPGDVIEIVEALTMREGEAYGDAVRRAADHPEARQVKIADVADNLDPDRLALLDEAEAERLRAKYAMARRILDERS
jgi:(p)ppGpp synthase/HD superfamily hydrolase